MTRLQDQPAPVPHPGATDVISDLAARIAVSGSLGLDGRTAAIVGLLLTYCAPPDVPRRALVVWLCGELSERRKLGTQRYGTPLQVGNGRNALSDLAQELLDAAAYSHQLALETERAEDGQ